MLTPLPAARWNFDTVAHLLNRAGFGGVPEEIEAARAAAPMFALGGRVKPGLFGKYPSLTRLDDGDPQFNTDFGSVYGTILEQWLGAPSAAVLGRKFPPSPRFWHRRCTRSGDTTRNPTR